MRTRHTTVGAALAAIIALTAGCAPYVDRMDDDDPATAPGRIEILPAELDFGTLMPLGQLELPLTVRNVGDGPLTLEALTIDGSASFGLADNGDPWLDPRLQTIVFVSFAGLSAGAQQATLEIHSDDPTALQVDIPLSGACDGPMIELDPQKWDFGDHEVGCEQEQEIVIRNAGNAPLELSDLMYAPTSSEMQLSFYFPEGTTLGPNQEQVATVYYAPVDDLADTGYLHVYSDDPWTPDALATQTGTAHYAAEVVDEFVQEANNQVDFLWVVDDTGWVADEFSSIQISIAAFTDILDVIGFDYHQETVATNSTQLFDYAYSMLTPPMTSPGGPMDGFLREDAGLHIVFLSAADDQSPDTVMNYVTHFQGLEADPNHVLLSAVSGQANGCTSGNLAATPAPRLHQATQMANGLSASICDPNWIKSLSQLAWLALSWQDTFELSQDPAEETIEVELNHAPLYVGWYYDEFFNAVVFEPDYIPDVGVEITIRYRGLGTCEG